MPEQTFVEPSRRLETLSADLVSVLTTPIVSDSLDTVGLRDQVMSRGLSPLVSGSRVIGRAATVSFEPGAADPDDPYGDAIAFIDSLAPGSVVVIAAQGDSRTAYWGELFTAAALGRGVVGVICDGPVRDTPKVRTQGLPVFAAGTRPIDFRDRMRVSSTGQAVVCGGVPVAPGDLVLADDDGVVVVPASSEEKALGLAVTRATRERDVLTALRAGALLRQVWDEWKVL